MQRNTQENTKKLESNQITEESLKRLNDQNNKRDELNNELVKAIEKQVNIYLNTVAKKEDREQLSKPQLINSHRKTWDWLSKVREQNEIPVAFVPKEYLDQDLDPVLYDPNITNNINNNPESDAISAESMNAHPGQSKLSGEDFMKNVLPQCYFPEDDMQVKQIRMKEWLVERQTKLVERDRMRQWMKENNYDEMRLEQYSQQWQSIHPQHTAVQWIEIYHMKSNHLLSTNELLRLYRNEVPSATRYEMKSSFQPKGHGNSKWDRRDRDHQPNQRENIRKY
jgi:hypothetical protein